MIAVVAILEVKPGMEKDMEAAFSAYMKKVRTEEGTLTYMVNRAQKNPAKFLIYETYRDRDALSFHGSTEYFMELFTAIAPLFAKDPVIETYDIIAAK